ncbi:MAG: hypothetical protein FJ217_03845 [Ignavibacteria bacterium]|nr:hypothetical protein [Ignavibacteria bacterium]
MNIRTLLLWGIISILLLYSACQSPTEPEESQVTPASTLVKGTVLRSDNLNPIPDAFVYDLGGLAKDTSKKDGSFALGFKLTTRYVSKVVGTRVGFGNDTVNIVVNPGVDTSIVLRLKADSLSPITTSLSGKAASIFLIGVTAQNIGIRGTGSNETAQLTFEVRDSVGVPVTGSNKINVNFSILGGPGGGEFIFPVSLVSDPVTGRASTRLTSGTKAGVVQVFASAVVDGRLIKSSPVRITIAGGLPVQERFSLSRQFANIAGGLYDNLRNRIQAIVGDRDGNPVQPGTAVYFTTTGGIIQASAQTDVNGIAAVELITSNPRPTGGIAVITAKTIGDSGNSVSRTIPVVFSGATRIVAPTQPFVIPDSGEYSFNYKVQDINGNPLTEGTTISVALDGPGSSELAVEGDKSFVLPDTDDPRYTQFFIRLRDRREGGPGGLVNITITVTSVQNGNAIYTFSGLQQSEAGVITVPPSAREPAQIKTFPPSATDIYVAGVGERENSVLTYQVLDSLETPITKEKRVYATYTVQFYPNSLVGGGTAPTLIPSADSTDDSGRLRTSVKSGTQAGVVQVIARVQLPSGKIIVSQPVKVTVHSGFPVRSHFTYATTAYSFGILSGGVGPSFFVQVGDTFSNPVAIGTAVYFHTQAGVVQTGRDFFGAYTDANGRAFVRFLGGNPEPTNSGTLLAGRPTFYQKEGYFWVYAQTQGRDKVTIIDSLRVLWCVPPITATGVPTTDVTMVRGGTSVPIPITFTDGRGNPLPVGTKITTTIEFTSDLIGIKFGVSGDLSTTKPFTMQNYPAVVDPGSRVTNFTIYVSDLSSSGGAPSGQTFIVNLIVEAPNLGDATFSFRARIL